MAKPGTYAFRHAEPLPYMTLDSIGWHTADSEQYRNDGRKRTDNGHVIFQYTLSGAGVFEQGNGETQRLTAGMAFAVTVPSDHRYYYDSQQQEPWEFIWFNAKGEDAVRLWERIIARRGPCMHLPEGSLPVERLWEMYRAVSEDRVSDPAALSSYIYNFAVTLLMPDSDIAPRDPQTSPLLHKAKQYMKQHYDQPLSIEQIASHCGISRSYLCRLFNKKENDTPLDYLRRRRVEAAVRKLRRTDKSVQQIGAECGFENPSYFGKVFRHYIGLSPREYRERKLEFPFDTVFLD